MHFLVFIFKTCIPPQWSFHQQYYTKYIRISPCKNKISNKAALSQGLKIMAWGLCCGPCVTQRKIRHIGLSPMEAKIEYHFIASPNAQNVVITRCTERKQHARTSRVHTQASYPVSNHAPTWLQQLVLMGLRLTWIGILFCSPWVTIKHGLVHRQWFKVLALST